MDDDLIAPNFAPGRITQRDGPTNVLHFSRADGDPLQRHVRPAPTSAELRAWADNPAETCAPGNPMVPMHPDTLRALVAEIERLREEIASMRADFASYFALADASWIETCELAAKRGITSVQIGPAQAKAMDKFNDLRALYGPNK